jgi:hypothetical protein
MSSWKGAQVAQHAEAAFTRTAYASMDMYVLICAVINLINLSRFQQQGAPLSSIMAPCAAHDQGQILRRANVNSRRIQLDHVRLIVRARGPLKLQSPPPDRYVILDLAGTCRYI